MAEIEVKFDPFVPLVFNRMGTLALLKDSSNKRP